MSEPVNNPVEAPAQQRDYARPTPGEYLRKLREEKGLTHAAVGAALHLTVHYIKALEGDEYGKLPGLTFVKGYLRSYARFLGADVDNVLARFDEHITGLLDAGLHTARVQRSRQRQDQALRWAIGAGFVVVVAIAAGWWYMSGEEAPAARATAAVVAPQPAAAPVSARNSAATSSVVTPQTQSTNVAPVIQTPAIVIPPALATTLGGEPGVAPRVANTPVVVAGNAVAQGRGAATDSPALNATVVTNATAAPTAPGVQTASNGALTLKPDAAGARQVSILSTGDDELRVSFNGNSWIEVDDGSMVRLYNAELSAGDTLTIRGKAPFRVLLGNARQVSMSLNAAAVDFSANIRNDSTARVLVGAPAVTEAPL